MMRKLQKLGKSLMLPVACLPVAGILMGIGYWIDPTGWGSNNLLALLLIKAGGILIDNIPILFALGVAIGMQENLFSQVNIDPANTHLPNGLEADTAAECRRYNQVLRSCGGIDLQLLGIGHNGHIGFNEPGVAFEKETHCVALTASTVAANRRFFEREEDVPRRAYTMLDGVFHQRLENQFGNHPFFHWFFNFHGVCSLSSSRFFCTQR